mgnify:CR=1
MNLSVVYDIIARFPCNASGVRVAVRKTIPGAKRYAQLFSRRNGYVKTRLRARLIDKSP